MRTTFTLGVLASLLGCPVAAEPEPLDDAVEYAFPVGDAAEVEPNDSTEQATVLGPLAPPFAVTGAPSSCGDGGTWDGADIDWLRIRVGAGDPLRLVLDMHAGDLDLALFDDAEALVEDAAAPGLDDESIAVSLDPERDWLLRVRCWQGRADALWRLRLEPP